MVIKRSPLRYAHTSGYTDLCYSTDGKYILTCGRDGDIRIWLSVEDDDPKSICAGDFAQAVRFSADNRIYLANDGLGVQILSFPDGKRIGILATFTAYVTHLAIDSTQKYLVAGSEDMSVKVINLVDEKVIRTFSNSEGPILSVAISPGGEYCSASSGDGLLRIWSTDNLVKEINCVPFVNNFNSATVYCRGNFDPVKGKYFAYPDTLNINVLETNSWKMEMTFTNSSIKGVFSICDFSSDGKLLAAATTKGCFCIWSIETKNFIGYSAHPNKNDICSFVWNPQGNGEIVYCDMTGELGLVSGCNNNENTTVIVSELKSDNKNNVDEILTRLAMDDDDDEDGDNIISLEKIKSGATFTDNLLADEDNIDDDLSRPTSPTGTKEIALPLAIKSILNKEIQAPFQPSSTPLHLNERYLVWNEIGEIRAFNETDSSYIDIAFHDLALHHKIHMANNSNYTMGDLSTTAVALASDTKFVCIVLNGNREWKMETDEQEEEILCLTVSDTHVAVATDTRLLRIFTINGLQRDVICIPGPVVALASNKNTILVAYHHTISFSLDQQLHLIIVNVDGISLKSIEISLPLSAKSQLSWLGLTNLNSPVIYDSSGVMRLYSSSTTSTWHPIFDFTIKQRKGVSDGLFIINVDEASEIINAVMCKGANYPPITPRAIVGEYQFTLPLLLTASSSGFNEKVEKCKLEDRFIRSLHSPLDMTKSTMESGIKLFSHNCNESEQKAYELVEMLSTTLPKFVQIAWKYAARKHLNNLADKLTNLIEQLTENQTETTQSKTYLVDEINENRENLLNQLAIKKLKNNYQNDNEDVLRPLSVKQDSNKRTITCKSPVNQLQNEEIKESQVIETPSPLTLSDNKNSRNPFSKIGKAPIRKFQNPFDKVDQVSDEVTNETNQNKIFGFGFSGTMSISKKRKEPVDEHINCGSNEPVKKQSKLSQFQKITDD